MFANKALYTEKIGRLLKNFRRPWNKLTRYRGNLPGTRKYLAAPEKASQILKKFAGNQKKTGPTENPDPIYKHLDRFRKIPPMLEIIRRS